MKKIISFILCLTLCCSVAFAEVDLSGMSYDELIALKNQINLAIWNSQEWQEVTVPQGIWVIGEDIPAGHWTISAQSSAYVLVTYGELLDDTGRSVSPWSSTYAIETIIGEKSWSYNENAISQIDLVLKDGCYLGIDGGSVIFTPYTGKPSLGFK